MLLHDVDVQPSYSFVFHKAIEVACADALEDLAGRGEFLGEEHISSSACDMKMGAYGVGRVLNSGHDVVGKIEVLFGIENAFGDAKVRFCRKQGIDNHVLDCFGCTMDIT